jgi:hypothetical protein
MQTRIQKHIRNNVVGYVAVFLALTGTAAATHPGGADTIDSADIINAEVNTQDLANNSVSSDKINNGAVRSADVADDTTANALKGIDIANASLTGADVAANSLTGTQISEPQLGRVPESTSSLLGGTGRSSGSTKAQSCDPESQTLIVCDRVSLTLAAPSRVLVIGQITAMDEVGADRGLGTCELGTSVLDLPSTSVGIWVDAEGPFDRGTDDATMVGVTPVLGPGNVEFRIRCNQDPDLGAIQYLRSEIAAVALSRN